MDIFEFAEAYQEFLSTGRQVIDSIERSLEGIQDEFRAAGTEIERVCRYELHVVCRDAVVIFFRSVFSGGIGVLEAGVLSHNQKDTTQYNVMVTKTPTQYQPELTFEGQGQDSLLVWLNNDVIGEVVERINSDFKMVSCHKSHEFFLVEKSR